MQKRDFTGVVGGWGNGFEDPLLSEAQDGICGYGIRECRTRDLHHPRPPQKRH